MEDIERCCEGCGARCFFRGGLFGGVGSGESVSLVGGVGSSVARYVLFCFRRSFRLVDVAGSVVSWLGELSSYEGLRQGSVAIGCGPTTCARGNACIILENVRPKTRKSRDVLEDT
jgi:hypothetical protein